MIHLSEQDVKTILYSYNNRCKEIHERILATYLEAQRTDEFIYEMSIASPAVNGMPKKKGVVHDLYSVFTKHNANLEERRKEAMQGILRLTDEEEALNRVWACYKALCDEEFDVLTRLYVKRQPWKAVIRDKKISNGTLSRIQKRAISQLLDMYYSDFSITEINVRSTFLREEMDERV